MGWMSAAQGINRAAAHMSQTELCTSGSLHRPDEEDACWDQDDMDEETAGVLDTLRNLMHKGALDELKEKGADIPSIRDGEPDLIDETLYRIVMRQLDEEIGDSVQRKARLNELNSYILGQQWHVPTYDHSEKHSVMVFGDSTGHHGTKGQRTASFVRFMKEWNENLGSSTS